MPTPENIDYIFNIVVMLFFKGIALILMTYVVAKLIKTAIRNIRGE